MAQLNVFLLLVVLQVSKFGFGIPISDLIDTGKHTEANRMDSCVLNINQLSLEIGFKRIELGKTHFSEIKKVFRGQKLIKSKERTLIDLANGFFFVESKLFYPDLGIQFISTSADFKGRSFFQNYRVNRFILEKNCKYKTYNGLGIGSTYQDIVSKLCSDYHKSRSKKSSPEKDLLGCEIDGKKCNRLYYTIRISEKMKLLISFYGNEVHENTDFVVDEKIEMYIIRSYS